MAAAVRPVGIVVTRVNGMGTEDVREVRVAPREAGEAVQLEEPKTEKGWWAGVFAKTIEPVTSPEPLKPPEPMGPSGEKKGEAIAQADLRPLLKMAKEAEEEAAYCVTLSEKVSEAVSLTLDSALSAKQSAAKSAQSLKMVQDVVQKLSLQLGRQMRL
jgi:hypothetical protein